MPMTVRYTVIDGEVIAEKRNGVRKQYVPDPLGSTVALLDNTQTQTDTFSYWPYGEVTSHAGTTPTPLQFVGTQGYHKDSANRTYIRARTLDTQFGRWLTQDPIGFRGGDANLYRYVWNMVPFATDPSGLKVYKCDGNIGTGFHSFISTDTCGAWGFNRGKFLGLVPFPLWPGLVENCDSRLLPVDPSLPTAGLLDPPDPHFPARPGHGGPGYHCYEIKGSAQWEKSVCSCLEDARRPNWFGPWYIAIGQNCRDWETMIFDCACQRSKQGEWNPYREWCQPVQKDPRCYPMYGGTAPL